MFESLSSELCHSFGVYVIHLNLNFNMSKAGINRPRWMTSSLWLYTVSPTCHVQMVWLMLMNPLNLNRFIHFPDCLSTTPKGGLFIHWIIVHVSERAITTDSVISSNSGAVCWRTVKVFKLRNSESWLKHTRISLHCTLVWCFTSLKMFPISNSSSSWEYIAKLIGPRNAK